MAISHAPAQPQPTGVSNVVVPKPGQVIVCGPLQNELHELLMYSNVISTLQGKLLNIG
jgi:hypothetical protein